MNRDEARKALLETALRAQAIQEHIDTLHARLSAHPDPGGPLEDELSTFMARRQSALANLGLVVLRARVTGADVRLVWPEDAGDGAPAPVTPEPTPVRIRRRERAVLVEPVRGPVATAESLQSLTDASLGPNWQATPDPAAQAAFVRRVLEGLGEPQRIETMEDFHDEVRRVLRACGDIEQWIRLPKADQRALVGMCATRSRHLQDEAAPFLGASREVISHLNMAFSLLTRYSAEKRPGFVKGLSRNQKPDLGLTWLDHARSWWDDLNARLDAPVEPDAPDDSEVLADLRQGLEEDREGDVIRLLIQRCVDSGMSSSDPRLVELLVGYPSVLDGMTAFKTLRTRIKESLEEEEEVSQVEDEAHPIPEDWPHWEQTRGKAAILVGGDTRPQAAERIQRAFAFDSVEWERGWRVRKVESLAKRIESGNVDLIILLRRFMSHWVFDHVVPACREAGVPFAVVDTGYGVNQVKRSLERYLGDA